MVNDCIFSTANLSYYMLKCDCVLPSFSADVCTRDNSSNEWSLRPRRWRLQPLGWQKTSSAKILIPTSASEATERLILKYTPCAQKHAEEQLRSKWVCLMWETGLAEINLSSKVPQFWMATGWLEWPLTAFGGEGIVMQEWCIRFFTYVDTTFAIITTPFLL